MTDNNPPADDVVARLLEPHFISDDDHRKASDELLDTIKLMRRERREAATEIERLRAERDEAREYGAQARIRENAANDARIHEYDRAEAAQLRIRELEDALNTRDLFINPDMMERWADEIDCSGNCQHVWTDDSVNYSECRAAARGDYCPNDLAETLRALTKVARARALIERNSK